LKSQSPKLEECQAIERKAIEKGACSSLPCIAISPLEKIKEIIDQEKRKGYPL
jgi:hypothetical protein